jgi:hypothetical protein
MGVDRAKVTQGANIGQYDCHPSNGVSNQHWEIFGSTSSNDRVITNEKSTEAHLQIWCVGVERGKTTRAQLKQAPWFNHSDQIWEVKRRDSDSPLS